MDELKELARWFLTPPSPEEMIALQKIASILGEAGNVARQLGPKAMSTVGNVAAVGAAGSGGLSEYRKSKALFNPEVQFQRQNFYGA